MKKMMTATEIIKYLKDNGIRDTLTRSSFYYWRVYAKPKLDAEDYEIRHDKGRYYYVYNLDSILKRLEQTAINV